MGGSSICFVCDSFISDERTAITGPMVQTYLLGKEFASRGWVVSFVAYNKSGLDDTVESYEGLRVHWIGHRRFLPVLNYVKVRRALARVNADYYYQRGRDILGGWASSYCRAHRKKFIWASAGESGVEKNKYLAQLRRKKRTWYKFIPLWLEARLNDVICNRGLRRADLMIVQTIFQRDRLLHTFGRQSHVIQSGHPVPPAVEKQHSFTVLWIGSIKKVKRPELYLELARVSRHLECEFWMAGQVIDPTYKDLIDQTQRELPNFKYLGAVRFDQSQALISKVHALVNTTDDGYEGLPNAFVQAWLGGTLTLSLHSDPDGYMTNHGIGIRNPDLAELSRAIGSLIADQSTWKEKSARAAALAAKDFSVKRIVDQLTAAMHSLKTEHGPSST